MPYPIHLITSLTDLTSLIGSETKEDILKLCATAQTENGNVAAVCTYPKHIVTAKEALAGTHIKVATVVNFPSGKEPLAKIMQTIQAALSQGADEIDLVMPYHLLKQGQVDDVLDYLKTCRQSCLHHCLKVIIESGELTEKQIIQASELVIAAHADFIKTSTGKTTQGATLAAAELILKTIETAKANTGIKLSGGIRTLDIARKYLALAENYLGKERVTKSTFRIGTSKLLTQ